MLQHIYNFVDGIEAKTDNLPQDPASSTDVANAQSAVEGAISDAESAINSNTNTAVSGLASQTDLSGVQTVANTIRAKTDNLPTDPADQSILASQLTNIQSDTDDIQTQLGGLSGGNAAPKAITVHFVLNPADNTAENHIFLPREFGKIYSGHITAMMFNNGNNVALNCLVGERSTDYLLVISNGNIIEVNEDFACEQIRLQVIDFPGGGDASGVTFTGTIQYLEITDVATE